MTRPRNCGLRSAALLTCVVLGLLAGPARPDPRLWGEDGVSIRQGHHVEWTRAGFRRADGYVLVVWSDTRSGNRDVYGQLISPSGVQLWESTGQPIISYPYRQEDAEVVAVTGGWIVAWIEFREDSTGDVWAQKLDDNGNLLWDPIGVPVDRYMQSMVNEYSVRAVHDGAGGAIIAWEDTRRGDPGDIYAQRISAAGTIAWSSPLAVTDMIGDQTGITADADGYGNLLVAWNDKRDAANTDIYASKVTSQGQLPWGDDGVAVCAAPQQQSAAKLCPDGRGGCYLAWVDQRTGSSDDLYIQRLDSLGQRVWTENGIPLCNATDNQGEVRVAVSINGNAADGCLAVWEDVRVNGTINEVYAQKVSLSGTMLWAENGIKVCGDAVPDHINPGHTRDGVRLASDLAGGVVCAWEDTRTDGDWQACNLYAGRVLSGGTLTWGGSCGVYVASGPHQQYGPLIRADSGDGIFIVYDDTRYGSQTLRYQNLDLATGALTLDSTASVLVFGLDGNADSPHAVAMTPGRSAVVWVDHRYVRGGMGLFYQVLDTAGSIELQMNGDTLVPDNTGGSGFGYQEHHRVCPDGDGGFFCSFEDLRTGLRRIRLTRVNSAGEIACSRAGEIVFENAAASDQITAFCAPDGAGGCYVAWSGYNTSFQIDVFVMHMDADCQRLWAEPVRLADTSDDDMMFGFVSNPDGCCIAVWQSGMYGSFDISAARVCADGSVTWNYDVCDALNEQSNPAVVADGQGGAYFAWEDLRLPYRAQDVYAQHVTASGTESWTHNGIEVISDTLLQGRPALTVDSGRNLYVVWRDFRSGTNLDLRLQKITPAGTRLWPAAGKTVCAAPGDQSDQSLHVEGDDGLYVIWSDFRGYFPGVYGRHDTESGQPADGYWDSTSGGAVCDYYQWQTDPTIAADGEGGLFCAWVDQRASGKEPLRNIWGNRINDYTVSVHEIPGAPLPARPGLEQNYPNPFNPSTRIGFAIAQTQRVHVEVFNPLGQKVATLADGVFNAGKYEIIFTAEHLASGVYFYRLKTAAFVDVKKMTLLR